jgi:hypothetical protein
MNKKIRDRGMPSKNSIQSTRRRFLKNTAGGVFTLTLADLIAPPLRKAQAQMHHYY